MEPGVIENRNQYTVGEHGQFVDKTTNRLVEGEVQAIGFDIVNALTPPPAWRVRNSACWGYDHDEP